MACATLPKHLVPVCPGKTELRMAEEKQALLVGLLAGRDKVQTFLELLNQQAVDSCVQMQHYEPLPPPASEQRQDRLQALGYLKLSVALELLVVSSVNSRSRL